MQIGHDQIWVPKTQVSRELHGQTVRDDLLAARRS
jgi:hypothetical protein